MDYSSFGKGRSGLGSMRKLASKHWIANEHVGSGTIPARTTVSAA